MHGHCHSHGGRHSDEGQWAAGRRWRGGRFGGHGGRHGGNFGEGGEDLMRARRMLAQGDLRLVALALIADAPRHGYEIIKLLEEKTADWYSPSPGIVYPTLTYPPRRDQRSSTPSPTKAGLTSKAIATWSMWCWTASRRSASA
jgi:hypothetical protein